MQQDRALSVDDRLDSIERELEILQLAVKEPVPWYRSIPTLVSAVALFFSFGTTYVSFQRTASQDIHALRAELRGILQRLASLPKDNFELTQKYQQNPGAVRFLSGYINQENSLLARQANEIVKRLPREHVSAMELLAIGHALQNSYNLEAAQTLIVQAVEGSKELNDEVAALRAHASMQFTVGKPAEGRTIYQKALSVFSRYPNYDQFVQTSTHVWTELQWAISEANAGMLAGAGQRIASAEQLTSQLSPSPGKDMLQSQIAQAKAQLQSGGKIADQPPSLPKQ
jgi:hypothetical protein